METDPKDSESVFGRLQSPGERDVLAIFRSPSGTIVCWAYGGPEKRGMRILQSSDTTHQRAFAMRTHPHCHRIATDAWCRQTDALKLAAQ